MATIERRGTAPELESLIPTPENKKIWLSYWPNPESLCAHVETLGDGRNNWHTGAWTNDESFTGSKDMGEAIRLCRDGWQEGAARVAALRDKINAAHPIGPRVVRWDVAGAVASVPRALAGNPLNMRRVDSSRLRRRPILTLLSDMSNSGGTSSDALTNRAAVVAAIVDQIEAQGFACHVLTFERSTKGNTSQCVAATVKEPGASVDTARLAYGLGHASMFRRIAWAAFTENEFTKGLSNSLGMPDSPAATDCNARGAYLLPAAQANESAFATEQAAATKGLTFLIESLRQQDCPAFPKEQHHAA